MKKRQGGNQKRKERRGEEETNLCFPVSNEPSFFLESLTSKLRTKSTGIFSSSMSEIIEALQVLWCMWCMSHDENETQKRKKALPMKPPFARVQCCGTCHVFKTEGYMATGELVPNKAKHSLHMCTGACTSFATCSTRHVEGVLLLLLVFFLLFCFLSSSFLLSF